LRHGFRAAAHGCVGVERSFARLAQVHNGRGAGLRFDFRHGPWIEWFALNGARSRVFGDADVKALLFATLRAAFGARLCW
jgi:hypothetical protein